MFTVIPSTRNSNLYLIAALAVLAVTLLTFALVPAISASRPAVIPVTGISESRSDYYQRHLELLVAAGAASLNGDFYLRHPELSISIETGIVVDTADYILRHPELNAASSADSSDYFLRH